MRTTPQHTSNPARRTTGALLWTVQGLLAALFLFAGGMKLLVPVASMAAAIGLSGGFLRFIGVAEVLGALGLVLPGLLRIATSLTWLAAAGLTIIMAGAVAVSWSTQGPVAAAVPLVVGTLTSIVALRRRGTRRGTTGAPGALLRPATGA